MKLPSILRALVLPVAAVLCMGSASDPADRLADPAKEARARALFQEVRCVVCQNESIDASNAELAHDMRQLIRGQVDQGRSNGEIRAFLKDRYGEFILFRPALTPGNAVLWGAPFVIVLGGVAALAWRARRRARRRARVEDEPLTEEELARLDALAANSDNGDPSDTVGP